MNRSIILASQSPRRKELLSKMGLQYAAITSNYEESLDESRKVEEVAMELALGKALAVANMYPDAIVIGSDTIVVIDGKQLEKPKDEKDAYRLLKLLSGKSNEIVTGLAVVIKSESFTASTYDVTEVVFKPFNENAVRAYIATGDPMDKAGAYGIQSGAAPLIDLMKGNYDTAIGLPTIKLSAILNDLGVKSKPVNQKPPVPHISKS